jgi:hypothetical protein
MNAWLPQASYPCGTVVPVAGRLAPNTPLAPAWLRPSSRGYFSVGPDYILSNQLMPAAHCHLVSEPSPSALPGRELGCGLSNLERFYHTLGHYPGHRLCFHAGLVARALRNFPQFDSVAHYTLKVLRLPSHCGCRWTCQAFRPTKANHDSNGNFSDTSSFKSRKAKGSIGHAFTVCIRTENQNQMPSVQPGGRLLPSH